MLKTADNAVPVACWSCSVAKTPETLFCQHCSKIQPPLEGDFYSVFNLERKLNLDLAALEREFHRLTRKLHPDNFARATETEQAWSLADTAMVNDAYRTLKDPIRRTEYLLMLEGAQIGEEHSGKNRVDPSRVPADLLEEVFDLNMQLEEMRAARKLGETDAALEADLQTAKIKFDGLMADVDEQLKTQWGVWDQGDEATRKSAMTNMVSLIDRRNYIRNLVRDVNEALGS